MILDLEAAIFSAAMVVAVCMEFTHRVRTRTLRRALIRSHAEVEGHVRTLRMITALDTSIPLTSIIRIHVSESRHLSAGDTWELMLKFPSAPNNQGVLVVSI